jgi:hypothetical protein
MSDVKVTAKLSSVEVVVMAATSTEGTAVPLRVSSAACRLAAPSIGESKSDTLK